jgi:predicted AAA+ superfamily ATPase
MAISNKERVGRALEALLPELRKYVEQELRDVYGDEWETHLAAGDHLDVQRLVNTLINKWDDVFDAVLTKDVKSLVHDVRVVRNKFAHDSAFPFDDTVSALIDVQKLLEAIQSPVAEEVERSKLEVMRAQFESGAKKEQKKAAQSSLGLDIPGLRPWREVVVPHEDVASGRFQQAEFAADLWQVYQGGGSDEYRDPRAFFGRTYLTEGLRELLVNAMRRLRGEGGDPVVELKINFGGGKTHSMLALYHLFSGQAKASELAGMEDVLTAVGASEAPVAKRAVIVGTALRPGSPIDHEDAIVTQTLWGEIAWQLAGREGYEIVREVDENSSNPGDLMDKVFALAGPSLILIDEWVAYARQLFKRDHRLPAGDFDTQFTFAQTLCEAARRAKDVLVCVSIPASERDGVIVSSAQAGDEAGKVALERLQDAVGRSNMVWRPATSDESFEIVRRRLFQPVAGDLIASRDATIKEFVSFYRANPNDFPSECREAAYERRMQAAYPIHPEFFDRLYSDWSTLEKFQRTRGVLRLMASVVHSLWVNGDGSALILPASIPLADPVVQSEVTRYLPESWSAVLDRDVDGANSVPMQLDSEFASTYGRYSACRRVARTVFMGSAPTKDAANRGIDELRIKLGSVQPKETIATFSDGLNKLRQRTTYLYGDHSRYWYHTQASVNREAQDRADRLRTEEIHEEIVRRLRDLLKGTRRGDFGGVHVDVPSSDIPDDRALRLVVVGPGSLHRHGKSDSDAIVKSKEVLEYRGSAPRSNRNRLVFAAMDAGRFSELENSVRQYLAWASIVEDVIDKKLDLDNSNKAQAEASKSKSNAEVLVKLGEVVSYAVVPYQADPRGAIQWESIKIAGDINSLAERIVKKLENDQYLTRKLGGNVLRKDIDRVPLWRDNAHVNIAQLQDDFSKYLYLPRLIDEDVLLGAIRDGLNPLDPDDGFAYADAYDTETNTYHRPRFGALFEGQNRPNGWLINPTVAQRLIDAELAKPEVEGVATGVVSTVSPLKSQEGMNKVWGNDGTTAAIGGDEVKARKRRFHGTIRLEHADFRERAGDLSREVVAQLAKVVGSKVEIIVEVVAEVDAGFSDDVLRAVSENCRTLKFDNFEFEDV